MAVLHRVIQIGETVVNFGIFTGEKPKISRLMKVRTERLPWQRARIAFRREVLLDFTPELAALERLPYALEGAIAFTRRELGGTASKGAVRAETAAPRAVPVVDAEVDVAGDGKSSARPTVATGVVTSAGMVKVTPTGRDPYRVFQIVVSEGASRAIFTGVDLLEKFNSDVFGMHDRIHIEKIKESFSVESGGKKKKREKNTYQIVVLERAQN